MKKRGAESGPDGGRPSTTAKLSSCTSVTVSAPGKVLVAGGYLVLERPNVGLVLASSARFYTTASWADPDGDDGVLVSVHSPQFGQDLRYKLVESAMDAPASSCLAEQGCFFCASSKNNVLRSNVAFHPGIADAGRR